MEDDLSSERSTFLFVVPQRATGHGQEQRHLHFRHLGRLLTTCQFSIPVWLLFHQKQKDFSKLLSLISLFLSLYRPVQIRPVDAERESGQPARFYHFYHFYLLPSLFSRLALVVRLTRAPVEYFTFFFPVWALYLPSLFSYHSATNGSERKREATMSDDDATPN